MSGILNTPPGTVITLIQSAVYSSATIGAGGGLAVEGAGVVITISGATTVGSGATLTDYSGAEMDFEGAFTDNVQIVGTGCVVELGDGAATVTLADGYGFTASENQTATDATIVSNNPDAVLSIVGFAAGDTLELPEAVSSTALQITQNGFGDYGEIVTYVLFVTEADGSVAQFNLDCVDGFNQHQPARKTDNG